MTNKFASQIVFTPRAKGDLSEIWNYSHNKWGPEQANNYARNLYAAIEK